MENIEPILFNLNYQINGQPVDCGIKQRQVDGETVAVVCANIAGEQKEFELRIDFEDTAFHFVSQDVPDELKAVEQEISNAIFRHDA